MAPLTPLAALGTLLLLVGCAHRPVRELQPGATQASLDGRTLGDAGLQRFLAAQGQGAAVASWDVPRFTLAAFYFNPELDVARAQVAEVEAGVVSAAAWPNPTFTFTPGRVVSAPAGVSPWILGYALNLPLELSGKRAARREESRARVTQAGLALASRAWGVHREVREAWLDLRAAEALAELQGRREEWLAAAARLVEVQVVAGEAPGLRAGEARWVADQSALAANEARRAVAQARSRLAQAVGVPLAALSGISLATWSSSALPSVPALAEARGWAAANRPDLLAALADYAAEQAALQRELSRRFPDFTLGPGYQFDQGQGKWSVGLGLTLPVLDRNQGPIAAAEARRAAAEARFVALQHRVLAEVDRAWAELASIRADEERVQALRLALEQQVRRVRAQHAAGDSSRLELVRAEAALADQARLEIEVNLRAARALGACEDAVQRPVAWNEAAWSRPRQESAK